MGTYDPYRQRHTVWWAQLLFMVVAAAGLVGVIWVAWAFLLSLASYIPSQLP